MSKSKRRKSTSKALCLLWFILGFAAAIILVFIYEGKIEIPQKIKDYFGLQQPAAVEIPEGSAQVHFIDVGEGDCSLIISDDAETVLIDCGEYSESSKVLSYLKKLGIKKLDFVIATHPHSDHIGGMSEIISSDIEIGRFIMPKIPDEYIPTTYSYEKMLEALSEKGCEVAALKDETVMLGSGELRLICPEYDGDNLNNYSAVARFSFGNNSFIFSGDLEEACEKKIAESYLGLKSDVYKVGHHGSYTSSCPEWLRAICPDYCVIECGADNSYGHPNDSTVSRLAGYADVILRTDLNGDIVFTTDGSALKYECSE